MRRSFSRAPLVGGGNPAEEERQVHVGPAPATLEQEGSHQMAPLPFLVLVRQQHAHVVVQTQRCILTSEQRVISAAASNAVPPRCRSRTWRPTGHLQCSMTVALECMAAPVIRVEKLGFRYYFPRSISELEYRIDSDCCAVKYENVTRYPIMKFFRPKMCAQCISRTSDDFFSSPLALKVDHGSPGYYERRRPLQSISFSLET